MSITVTETAIKELKKVREEQKLSEDTVVRVGVSGGGCSGFMYDLKFTEANDFNAKADKKIEIGGLTFVVDKKSDLYLDGTKLDFYEELAQRGFVFDNPNAVKSCGCGKSFQA